MFNVAFCIYCRRLPDKEQPMRSETIGAAAGLRVVLREALALLLTCAAGIVLVSLVVFAPKLFFSGFPPTAPGLPSYLAAVRAYLAGLLAGDFGRTASLRSIAPDLLIGLTHSLQLLAVSVAVALPVGLGWGALLASTRRRLPAALLFGLSTLAISLPSFVVMLLAMEGVANLTQRTGFQLAYVQGYGLDRHLVLPTAVLALRGAAVLARSAQVAQESIMRQDWVRAARGRGLSGFALWRRHVLPALRLPLLGGFLAMLRVMVGGLIIVDYLSGWNGLGRLMVQVRSGSASPGEAQVVAGATIMLVVFFVVVDALGRLALRGADPRLRDVVSD
jgi:ABC-type dipeptide/oligopeptide/nickel transport system permease component